MGMIGRIPALVFGDGSKMVAQAAEVLRESAEAGAPRRAGERGASAHQFDAGFGPVEAGLFDRIMDGVNRLPRPALALGTLGLFIAAMVDPVWFGARMQGIALVPEPLWWLLGVIVSFYFGARHQFKGQCFHRQVVQSAARSPRIAASIAALESAGSGSSGSDDATEEAPVLPDGEANPALRAWREQQS